MNNQKWEALVTAIDLGSFSRAAEKLGYTQSGLTHMMNSLEAELGFPVIRRGYFGVKPTEAGEKILPKVRRLLAMDHELGEDIRRIREGDDGALRVGAYPSVVMHWLPSIVQMFRREYPDITVEIAQGSVSDLYEGLENDRFDMVFATRNDRYPCQFIPLRDDRLRAILPMNYPADITKPFPIKEFEKGSFLMPSLGFDIDIMTVFHEAGVTPRVVSTFVDDPAIISMVEHGLGISMLSELCIRGRSGNILCLPIEPDVSRQLGIAMAVKKHPTEIMRRFMKEAKKFAEAFVMEG